MRHSSAKNNHKRFFLCNLKCLMNIKKSHSVRHKALLSYIIVFDSTYKVLEFKVEEATEGLSETVIYSNIPFILNFWKEHGSCVFILEKTKLCANHTFELILLFWAAFISIVYTEHFGQTFQFLISSFLCIMPRSSQAHQSCYLNGWQIEYHSDHATLGILIYRVQGKNAEYKLFRNLLYQRVFPEHPPVAEQTDYFSLLIVLISYLPHWKQRVICETIRIKQQTNLASWVYCIEVNNPFSQSNPNTMPKKPPHPIHHLLL